jgi:hypothetical protein
MILGVARQTNVALQKSCTIASLFVLPACIEASICAGSDQGLWKELFARLVKAGYTLEIGLINGTIVRVHQSAVLEKKSGRKKRVLISPFWVFMGQTPCANTRRLDAQKYQNTCHNR